MKKLLLLAVVFSEIAAEAQSYLISFSGSGAATAVSTVKVENLKTGNTLTMNGSDILRLVVPTVIKPVEYDNSSNLKIYPNPVTDNTITDIFPPVDGNAAITVHDMTGRAVAQLNCYLERGRNTFRLSGIKKGFYIINVRSDKYQFSGRLLSTLKTERPVTIEKIYYVADAPVEKPVERVAKGSQNTVDMAYSAGERLKFTATTAVYSTVKTHVPTSDATITFKFIPCTDGDNNNYPVVEIGSQVWMAENLKTTRFNDGTALPSKHYFWHNDDSASYKDVYGALYTWGTINSVPINGGKNGCPTGWHVPFAGEWEILTNGATGGQLKETGYAHWLSPNSEATNETGFTALPGGSTIGYPNNNMGLTGNWWTSTPHIVEFGPHYLQMSYNNGNATMSRDESIIGFSVRCILGDVNLPTITTVSINDVTSTSANCTFDLNSNGGQSYVQIEDAGICWGTSPGPTNSDNHQSLSDLPFTAPRSFTFGIYGEPNTIYYVRSYYTSYSAGSSGIVYGNELIFKTYTGTVTDIEGNKYNTVTIGSQLWMAENLKTTVYNNKTPIPQVIDNAMWAELSTPGFCWYDAAGNKSPYGAFYNWYVLDPAGNGGRNVCPSGWHVPSDEEWVTMTDYLTENGYGYQGSTDDIAKSMAAGSGWPVSSTPGTPGNHPESNNLSGFTAFPYGFRDIDGTFRNINNDGYWWSSSDSWYRNMSFDYSKVYRGEWAKNHGFSVRCIHDTANPPTVRTVKSSQ